MHKRTQECDGSRPSAMTQTETVYIWLNIETYEIGLV
jgi:hypothetical protein